MTEDEEKRVLRHVDTFYERNEILNELLLDIQRTNADLVQFVKKAEDSNLFENLNNLQPWADLTDWLGKLNRFLKWGGITMFAFLGFLYFFFIKK